MEEGLTATKCKQNRKQKEGSCNYKAQEHKNVVHGPRRVTVMRVRNQPWSCD